jgi:hypothetical protein
MHVSNRVQSVQTADDGSRLDVSTERPALAAEVYVPFLSVPTVVVEDGGSVELGFNIPLPLRQVSLVGIPPRAETTEWTPSPQFELHMSLAVADRPFHLPARREDMAKALRD